MSYSVLECNFTIYGIYSAICLNKLQILGIQKTPFNMQIGVHFFGNFDKKRCILVNICFVKNPSRVTIFKYSQST